jgi:hypothetical protein
LDLKLVVWVVALVMVAFWAGFELVINGPGWLRRAREGAKPRAQFDPQGVGDEAEQWLRSQP